VPGTCVIGLQWGDEAKGKLVDLLTEDHDFTRFQGLKPLSLAAFLAD
jgi:adenylosuccinate synthase